MDELFNEKDFEKIIEAYRISLVRRYAKENLARFKELEKIERKNIDKLIQYFLDLLYPEYETRLELDAAFHSLGTFAHSPQKLFGVLGNIPYAIVKFGKLLIQALQAGMNALRSYYAAYRFERELFLQAKPMILAGKDISSPEIFDSLIAKIPKDEADTFRKQIIKLFEILANKELLEKIQEVMLHVIEKMEKKKNVYSDSDIKGIRMGYSIIEKGKEIFQFLNPEEIQLLLYGIDTIEKDFYETAVNKEKN
ncbi:MAG: hypothetical protein SFU98_05050 [Leptospiraceae bacterium]|nr:hypothetical protein [Leptospiraceae bacterium]